VDKAVKRMVTEAYTDAKQILSDNRALLDEIAEHLLLKETITGEELMAFVNAPKAEPIEESAEESAE
jgi:cell division protease FtsH